MKNQTKTTLYQFQGLTKQGQLVSGEILAFNKKTAMLDLTKKEIRSVLIQKKLNNFFNKKISSFEIILFFRQLSTLITTGISITKSIHILSQQSENHHFLKILATIKNDIESGNTLSQSLRKFPNYFDPISRQLILAGEKSGTLDIMLERIACHKENLWGLKNKIKQALFYPTIIFLVAIIVTLIMLLFVVPRFTDLFKNAHAPLPELTQDVIFIADCLKNHWQMLLFSMITLGTGFYFSRQNPKINHSIDHTFLHLPILGQTLKKFILTRLAQNLAILLTAGITISEALKILTHTTRHVLYQNAIKNLTLEISSGKQLHLAMQYNKLFPLLVIQMIQVGEESGTLEKMLLKIADFYESDLNRSIDQLSKLLEPLIMVVLGVVIGILVIAMYLPIFKLGAVI